MARSCKFGKLKRRVGRRTCKKPPRGKRARARARAGIPPGGVVLLSGHHRRRRRR